jgi:methanogenic corrinoid protein MtbC1
LGKFGYLIEVEIMAKEYVLEKYLDALLEGDRTACRTVIEEALQRGTPANQVYMKIIWPVMAEIDKLYRQHTIDSAQEAFATRINRTIVDQLQNKLPRKQTKSKKIVVCSNRSDSAELGAQMISDLFESDGWETRHLGGSVNNDDILTFVHSYRPDILLIYGTEAQGAPDIRRLIDTVRKVDAFPEMKIMLSGGIFDRAEGLWEEIGADMYAPTAGEAVKIASAEGDDIPVPQRTFKQRKKSQEAEKQEVQEAEAVN